MLVGNSTPGAAKPNYTASQGMEAVGLVKAQQPNGLVTDDVAV